MTKLRPRVCMEWPRIALLVNDPDQVQFLTGSLWNRGFDQLSPSRVVYLVCRSMTPNTQSINSTHKPTAAGIFRGCCTHCCRCFIFPLWLSEVKKWVHGWLGSGWVWGWNEKHLVKIIWRVVTAQEMYQSKVCSSSNIYLTNLHWAQINGSHMGCPGPGHHVGAGRSLCVEGWVAQQQ